jgi:polysaccharide pyruvyl transferase WcaK-like protein
MSVTPLSILGDLSRASFVITQRLHGSILATVHGKPHFTMRHHDKFDILAPVSPLVNYYGFNKTMLWEAQRAMKSSSDLKAYSNRALSRWQQLAPAVDQACFG